MSAISFTRVGKDLLVQMVDAGTGIVAGRVQLSPADALKIAGQIIECYRPEPATDLPAAPPSGTRWDCVEFRD